MADFETLEARLEHDREALSRSLDTLSETLSPERLAANVNETVISYAGELGQQAATAAKQNPAAFALVGAGLALLLSGNRRGTASTHTAHGPESAMDGFDARVAEADATMRSRMTGTVMSPTALKLRASLDRGLDELPPKARARVLKARKAALDAQEKLERRARKTARKTKSFYHAQPLAVGAVALGIGALVGAALPGTRREDELLGARRDQLMAEAQRVMSDEIAALKATASKTLDDALGTGADRTGTY